MFSQAYFNAKYFAENYFLRAGSVVPIVIVSKYHDIKPTKVFGGINETSANPDAYIDIRPTKVFGGDNIGE